MYLSDDQALISGGIAGGISDGTPVVFRCVFKPTASNRKTFSALHAQPLELFEPLKPLEQPSGLKLGRHDACIAVRAVAVVEAMTALVIQDFLMDKDV
jgi:chorismate synthase